MYENGAQIVAERNMAPCGEKHKRPAIRNKFSSRTTVEKYKRCAYGVSWTVEIIYIHLHFINWLRINSIVIWVLMDHGTGQGKQLLDSRETGSHKLYFLLAQCNDTVELP